MRLIAFDVVMRLVAVPRSLQQLPIDGAGNAGGERGLWLTRHAMLMYAELHATKKITINSLGTSGNRKTPRCDDDGLHEQKNDAKILTKDDEKTIETIK